MQIIDELEPVKRGGYGGAIGYLGYARRPRHLHPHPHRRASRTASPTSRPAAARSPTPSPTTSSRSRWPRRSAVAARDRAGAASSRTGHDGSSSSTTTTRSPTTSSSTWASWGPSSRSCATTAPTSTSCSARGSDRVVVSPGPCTPDEAGISLEVVRALPRGRRSRRSACAWATSRSRRPSAARVIRHVPVHGKTTDDRARRPHDLRGPAARRSPSGATTRSSSTDDLPGLLRGHRRAAAAS